MEENQVIFKPCVMFVCDNDYETKDVSPVMRVNKLYMVNNCTRVQRKGLPEVRYLAAASCKVVRALLSIW